MHVLSRDEHELQDHHLQKFKVQHRIKRRTKKHGGNTGRRRRTTLGVGYSSKRLEEVDLPEFTKDREENVSFTVGDKINNGDDDEIAKV